MIKKVAVLFLILIVFLCSSCTGGRVTKNGAAVANATVRIYTCESIGDFNTDTNSSGIYTFNPFSPNSSALDQSKLIPPGPIGIAVTGNAGSSFTRRVHQYNSSCPVEYNGSTQNLPCKLQNIDLVPVSLPELLEETLAFFEQDCGLEAKSAEQISTAVVARLEGSLPLTSKPRTANFLSQCADSCIRQDLPISEYASCMCNCVESNHGTSFGSFCTEPDVGTGKVKS